jgi:hypothetical protein
VLKPGGKLISISGPPDVDFAEENGSNWFLQQVMRLLSLAYEGKPSAVTSVIRLFS